MGSLCRINSELGILRIGINDYACKAKFFCLATTNIMARFNLFKAGSFPSTNVGCIFTSWMEVAA